MAIDTERIFLLATKKSQRVENLTYCIGVHRLGTPNMEYILGETDNDREYRQGDEVSYIYHAEYAYTLQEALDWRLRLSTDLPIIRILLIIILIIHFL